MGSWVLLSPTDTRSSLPKLQETPSTNEADILHCPKKTDFSSNSKPQQPFLKHVMKLAMKVNDDEFIGLPVCSQSSMNSQRCASPASFASGFSSMIEIIVSTIAFLYSNPPCENNTIYAWERSRGSSMRRSVPKRKRVTYLVSEHGGEESHHDAVFARKLHTQ